VRRVVDHAVVGVLMQTRIRYHMWRQRHCRVVVCVANSISHSLLVGWCFASLTIE
jgi:predicted ferric reductase